MDQRTHIPFQLVSIRTVYIVRAMLHFSSPSSLLTTHSQFQALIESGLQSIAESIRYK